jgi:hypothetical protein
MIWYIFWWSFIHFLAIGTDVTAETPKDNPDKTAEDSQSPAVAPTAGETITEPENSTEDKVNEPPADETAKEEPEKPAQNEASEPSAVVASQEKNVEVPHAEQPTTDL